MIDCIGLHVEHVAGILCRIADFHVATSYDIPCSRNSCKSPHTKGTQIHVVDYVKHAA